MAEATWFRFDFADLAPPAVELRVLEGGVDIPAGASFVSAGPRPRWLGRLLPIFAAGRGLRISVSVAAAPTFGAVLLEAVAGIFASAGVEAGVRVAAWEEELLVGSHALTRMPLESHFHLVAADLQPGSLERAGFYLGLLPAERTFLVLNGREPGLERRLPVPAAAKLWRLPMLGPAELRAVAGGVPASIGCRRFGRPCLELVTELAHRYRAELR